MAKFNSKLPRKEVEKFFYQLCIAISETKTPKEAAELLRDLLSYQEAEMIAKRLKIAELLLDNFTYEEIIKGIKVSPPTIARVQEWLKISGEGYQRAVKTIKSENTEKRNNFSDYPESWTGLKRRFPAYYWPELLLESIIKESSNRQRKKIENVISQMEKMKEKNELFIKIKNILKRNKQ
jgi:uncharacterized protein YerC